MPSTEFRIEDSGIAGRRPGSYTLAGPPERMIPFGFGRGCSAVMLARTTWEDAESRTRLAMSRPYCGKIEDEDPFGFRFNSWSSSNKQLYFEALGKCHDRIKKTAEYRHLPSPTERLIAADRVHQGAKQAAALRGVRTGERGAKPGGRPSP